MTKLKQEKDKEIFDLQMKIKEINISNFSKNNEAENEIGLKELNK